MPYMSPSRFQFVDHEDVTKENSGNHEVRSIQQMFTFKAECVSKFGDDMGERVWEAVNKCFDALPLAAVIDDKVIV